MIVECAFGKDQTIIINLNSKQPERVFVHEVAHAIDHMGISDKSSLSLATDERHSLLEHWRESVLGSKAIDALLRMQEIESKAIDYEHLDYLLRMREIFARSYTQYIARVTGDATLLNQIAAESKGLYSASYWGDNDFVQISQAFDELMEKLQWLKRKT